MSVVDLGLIYDVVIDAGRVRIAMTLTTQGCPLHGAMTDWVRRAVGKMTAPAGSARPRHPTRRLAK